jgi:HEPN domain-containing protein
MKMEMKTGIIDKITAKFRKEIEKLKDEKKSVKDYLVKEIKKSHSLVNLFSVSSLVISFKIRLISFVFENTLTFTCNAIFYTDRYIEQRYLFSQNEIDFNLGFLFVLKEEKIKSTLSSIIQAIIIVILDLIKAPKEEDLNELLKVIGDKHTSIDRVKSI